ncbi:MAG: transglycosylase SLT domain-containing protein [Panacagrimonas sp.]
MLRSIVPRLILMVLVAVAAAPAFAQSDDPYPARRALFVEALAAIPRGLPTEDDAEALRSYELYPYLQAERLSFRLKSAEAAPDDAIASYLTLNGDAPWTRGLRAAWLKNLAERFDWPRFMAFYADPRADTALRCQELNALIATGADPSLRELALGIYRTGSDLPDACDPLIDWLREQGALTLDELAGRVRLALEAGKTPLARALIRQLPPEHQSYYLLWADILEDPQRNLERGFAANLEPKAIFDGGARLARKDADVALAVVARIEGQCSAPCRLVSPASPGDLRREIALNQAWSRREETVATFRTVPETALDERAHEWRVRAALWAGDWPLASQWIAAMPPTLAGQQRWRYWRARSDEKLERAEPARAGYEQLATENGYYPVLASERLDRAFQPHPGRRPADPAIFKGLAAQPGFVRAREAYFVDQAAWARTEWAEATQGFDPPRLIEAARLAASWGWMVQAVGTATRAEVFDEFDLLYPRPYETEVAAAARRSRLPAEWIYGVMRQESLYDPRARSSADALGLLQLLPETARAVARRGGLDTPTRTDLFDPATNVMLGAGYLREQLDTFGERFVLVLGAYNAGPNALRRWLPETAKETDVWIENVPFNETRNYIQRIIWNGTVFAWKASGKPQRITRWLTPITSEVPSDASPR